MISTNPRFYRKKALLSMIDEILEARKIVNEESLIAQYSNIYGTTRRTVLEYLKELELGGKIIRKKGDIQTYEFLNEQIKLEELKNLAEENQIQEAVENEKLENNANTGEDTIASNSTS